MLSATFHNWGGGADDPDFSVDLTRSTATFHTPEILYIIRRSRCTSQGDPDSSFPCLCNDMQCNEIQCNDLQCNDMQCNLCHSHYHFNLIRVGYGKGIQKVMQAEWLACIWCISNHDQVQWYHFEIFSVQIVLFIHWLYLQCFLIFIYATDVILPKFLMSDKIIVLNKQLISICFDLTIDIKVDIKNLKKLIIIVENLDDIF